MAWSRRRSQSRLRWNQACHPVLDGRNHRFCSDPHPYGKPQTDPFRLVRFAHARSGYYNLINFAVVLIGYMLSGESTLLAFYERLAPWANVIQAAS